MSFRLSHLRVVLPLLGGAAFLLGACGGDDAPSAPPTSTGGAAGAKAGGSAGSTTAGSAGATGGLAGKGGSSGAAAGGAAGTSAAGNAGAAGGGTKKPGATCAQDGECGLVGIETQPASCAEAYCNAGVCALRTLDTDGDGFRKKLCKLVSDGAFAIELGGDCDDTNKDVNPKGWDGPAGDGKPNGCGDGVDQDCSGLDGDAVTTTGASCSCVPSDVEPCAQTDGGAPIVFPGGSPAPGSSCALGSRTCLKDPTTGGGKWGPCGGAQGPSTEVCNNKDDDCDGSTDEDDAQGKLEWVYDGDSDGFRAAVKAAGQAVPFASRSACAKPVGTPTECDATYCGAGVDVAVCCPPDRWRLANTASAIDCDDRDTKVNPAASEVCGEGPADKDENCDGKTNELPAIGTELWFFDGDGDGYGDKAIAPQSSCLAPGAGWKKGLPNTDCDDKLATTNPGVVENCATAQDDNCNGTEKDGCSCVKGQSAPLDCGVASDCTYLPGGSVCGDDGKYSACPPTVAKKTYCPDADGDTYCDRSDAACVQACPTKSPLSTATLAPASGFLDKALCPEKTDCADDNANRSPGRAEQCGTFDQATDSDCDPSSLPDNGFDLGTSCDVGSGIGACKGAGLRACSNATSTTCQAPAGIPYSLPRFTAATNLSFDWNCDGVFQHGLYANGKPPGGQTIYPPGYQQGQFCVDVIDEGDNGGTVDPAPEFPQAPTPPKPAPWKSATCLHPTPDGTKYRVPTCAELPLAQCTSHYYFEGCREVANPLGTIDGKFTCRNSCGKYVKELRCVPSGSTCTGSVSTTQWYSGCY